ncbi:MULTISPECIES: hypothetical protein [unclassified Methylophilus]|jgi:hypothetical protein|uniref:hypothetical protein n=1 Tax=unclassified Methylophilus TaxID=2630143 RepID=UPI0006FD22D6|nr:MULTISPECIES: hypothetical protein [unclassified Methylophilus]KQT38176.1 hypothetical protein ASG24_04250 [Methylophilus sp. Leaf414]KQT43921.1 hypothetical protein ASG34_03915 [Methylophilus sp. Leaf416]KQT59405.1 hypothetical protein ASG44_03920 [Methylophilus sp. Leaf459]
MPQLIISHIERLNKRHYLLWLSDGQSLQLSITDMFNVKVMLADQEVASVHFQPLSSLNNIEMPPLYRINDYRAPAGVFALLADGFLNAILSVYAFYTHGIIKPWRAAPATKSLLA